MASLLTITSTDETAAALVGRLSVCERTFDHTTQDSGNVSWVVDEGGVRLFVKTAGDREDGHADLDNAVRLARSCDHPALPRLRNVISTATGPALVYDAAPGELVHVAADRRDDPTSAYQRFAHLPASRLLAVLDVLVDLHVALAAAGWIACDLYDGSLIVAAPRQVDEARPPTDDRLTVVDLDNYNRGPFTNTMGRMYGSSRFMAPEEHVLGATIDQRTTVFTLGRIVTHFATRLTDDLRDFVGSPEGAAVLRRACRPDPDERFGTVADLGAAWARSRRS